MILHNEKVWKDCLEYIEQKIKKESFFTWFSHTQPLPSGDGSLKIKVPNQFVAEWLKEHYGKIIQEALVSCGAGELKLVFLTAASSGPAKKSSTLKADEEIISDSLEKSDSSTEGNFSLRYSESNGPPLADSHNSFLNLKYTFGSFVVGESNRFAQAAGLAVAQSPGKTNFNPLYIYSNVGLGKTHLLQAIGNQVAGENKRLKVLYVTSEKFTNDFISCIGSSTMSEFTRRYRNVDVLLLDDIQFFSGKESTQIQFFHTFNTLHQEGKQIVLTSDRPPNEINGLEERLLSRFHWGLVTDIQPPDFETRVAILKKKADSEKALLPDNVLTFIARQVSSNIRELEGALTRLLALSSFSGQEVSLELAQQALKNSRLACQKFITLDKILNKVCEAFQVSREILCSPRRTAQVARARQAAMYLSRKLTKSSLNEIGLKLGGKDHSTVLHAYNLIEKTLTEDVSLKARLDKIVQELSS